MYTFFLISRGQNKEKNLNQPCKKNCHIIRQRANFLNIQINEQPNRKIGKGYEQKKKHLNI